MAFIEKEKKMKVLCKVSCLEFWLKKKLWIFFISLREIFRIKLDTGLDIGIYSLTSAAVETEKRSDALFFIETWFPTISII